jgi:hypothetical protein
MTLRHEIATRISNLLPVWEDLPRNALVRFLLQRFPTKELVEMEEDMRAMKRMFEENPDPLGRIVWTPWHETIVGIRTAYFRHKHRKRNIAQAA